MALVTDQPEDVESSNDLDNVHDPDAPDPEDRAEIYLSGSHVCTLEDAPRNRERVTLMVDLEVFEETTRANGDEDVPIRKARRVGDMYLPGTKRAPTNEELRAIADAAKAKAAEEKREQEERERAEREENEPPMFTEEGDPIPDPAGGGEPAAATPAVDVPPFSDQS